MPRPRVASATSEASLGASSSMGDAGFHGHDDADDVVVKEMDVVFHPSMEGQ
jgi:hypothetical protein